MDGQYICFGHLSGTFSGRICLGTLWKVKSFRLVSKGNYFVWLKECKALYYYSDLMLSQSFQPMATKLSVQTALPNILRRGHVAIMIQGPHDDVNKCKDFPRHWPFVRGIHRSCIFSGRIMVYENGNKIFAILASVGIKVGLLPVDEDVTLAKIFFDVYPNVQNSALLLIIAVQSPNIGRIRLTIFCSQMPRRYHSNIWCHLSFVAIVGIRLIATSDRLRQNLFNINRYRYHIRFT